MTTDEATRVMIIMSNADSGCSYCAADLYERFIAQFPDLDWPAVFDGFIASEWGEEGEETKAWMMGILQEAREGSSQ